MIVSVRSAKEKDVRSVINHEVEERGSIMNHIVIYDPPMCCPTGLCGANVNPELLRIATLISKLNKRGAGISRFSLSQNPKAFINNTQIRALLNTEGKSVLPITMVNNQIVKKGEYLTNEEFCYYLNIPYEQVEL